VGNITHGYVVGIKSYIVGLYTDMPWVIAFS
jgi:hypothetical protein